MVEGKGVVDSILFGKMGKVDPCQCSKEIP